MVNLYAKLISGGASLLVQVLLVVGAVLAFMWWDPFGIVSPQKQMLRDTPAQVESIKKLGELITAEYYGEVVSSLGEVADSTIEAQVDSIKEVSDNFHETFIAAIDSFVQVNSDIRNDFRKKFVESEIGKPIVKSNQFEGYTYFIFTQLNGIPYNTKKVERNTKLSTVQAKKLFKQLYKNKKGWRDKLKTIQTNEFVSVSREIIEKKTEKNLRRTRLALVGRGWIKAGIDFENFTEDNFIYNEDYQTIHFIGFEPKIVSATINPWFIPEKGVEGFEFLIANRKVKMRPDYVKEVKQHCLDKLKDQALRKGIKEKAMENAADYLKGFFSLLLDTEIKYVAFHKNQLSSIAEFVLMDDIISNEEIVWINKALVSFKNQNEVKNGWELPLIAFMDSLVSNHQYQLNTTDLSLHSKTQLLFETLGDGKIDSMDVVRFESWKDPTATDSLWYSYGEKDSTFESQLDLVQTQFKSDLVKIISPGDSTLNSALSNTLLVENQSVRTSIQKLFGTTIEVAVSDSTSTPD